VPNDQNATTMAPLKFPQERWQPGVVAGIWTSIDRDRLRAEFELRPDAPPSREAGLHLFQNARGVGPGAHRFTLPETETHTFV
jgi:hypothetical protein